MHRIAFALAALFIARLFMFASPALAESDAPEWRFGFGRRQIIPGDDLIPSLYIAGYHNDLHITGVNDWCEARAVWIDAGGEGVLTVGVDCVALDSGTIDKIRKAIGDVPGCAMINVYSTHTHAGPDTLGLWGPVGRNGKNAVYMNLVIEAAAEAAREAAASPQPGRLFYSQVKTVGMYRDSRYPTVYDENLYQLRFETDNAGSGLRLLFYGAHAESLRGDNTLLSRDYPGVLMDRIKEETGDDAMFLPGAIGGLIMTREMVANMPAAAVRNMNVTAEKLIEYALSIGKDDERELAPSLRFNRQTFTVSLDNTVFLLYKTLGILGHDAVVSKSATGFGVRTTLTVMSLDDVLIALIPGEMFPELVTGEKYGDANPDGVNPEPLKDIANRHGVETLLIVGLANDELGYIVPPSDFLLNDKLPYIERTRDARGEDHYEETNSVGPDCAARIANAFDEALSALFGR